MRHGLTRLYAFLLQLYPADHRKRWRAGMTATFEHRAADVFDAARGARWRFAAKELGSLLAGVAVAWLAQVRPPRRSSSHPRSPRREIMAKTLFDVRVAMRGWRRDPTTTIVIAVTLALGIGATTAIFSVVDAVLLRPLPFPEADRLVQVAELLENGDRWPMSMPDFVDYRDQVTTLDGIAMYRNSSVTLTGEGDPERVEGMEVAAGVFEMLGLDLPHGRSFTRDDQAEDAPLSIVLGNRFWTTRYDADPDVLGREIRIDGRPRSIVGIAPAGVRLGGAEPDVWLPWQITADGLANRGGHMYPVIGRLAEATPIETARQEVAAIGARIEEAYPESHQDRGATLIPLRDEIIGDVHRPMAVLLGAVTMLLIIACVNVTSILLARADARETEIALRAALGASSGRILRQLVTESVMLASVGGLVGVALAHLGVAAIIDTLAGSLPRTSEIGTDARILAFAVGITTLVGVAVGLVPALRATRADLYSAIKAGAGSLAGADRRRFSLRHGLVVAEIALAVMLVLGAGLLVQSLIKLQAVEVGIESEGAVTFRVGVPTSRYETPQSVVDFFNRLRGEIAQLPGVEAVGAIGLLPFFYSQTTELSVVGDADLLVQGVQFRHTTPGFLEAIGTRAVRGRTFDDGDGEGAPPVIILNRTLARRLFGNDDPIGRRVTTGWGHHPDELEVVGVVEDVKLNGPREASPPAMYWPFGQYDWRSTMSIVVRSGGDPESLLPPIRRIMSELDPELPMYSVESLSERTRRTVAEDRLITGLLSGFALVAVLLGAVGIFGVMAYNVVRRSREIGVRVALGAAPAAIVRAVLAEGAGLASVGIGIGAAGALALGRAFAHLLYDTRPNDPVTFAAVGLALVGVALLACFLPARRAACVDPMMVLRND